MWTPILDEPVRLINLVQSESLTAISFYTVTTPFAEEMLNNSSHDSVYLTGHSLGGGLAIISGAQAGVPAVAYLSGPNAMISGRSFEPPVTPEHLNRYTFNIVPDRDFVANLADMYQRIRCTAPKNAFIECHSFTKVALQDYIYLWNGRPPAICECHTVYDYPKPITDGDRKFEDVCSER